MPDATRLMPYLLYEDVDRAIDWLTAAFGLRESTRQYLYLLVEDAEAAFARGAEGGAAGG